MYTAAGRAFFLSLFFAQKSHKKTAEKFGKFTKMQSNCWVIRLDFE